MTIQEVSFLDKHFLLKHPKNPGYNIKNKFETLISSQKSKKFSGQVPLKNGKMDEIYLTLNYHVTLVEEMVQMKGFKQMFWYNLQQR